jgi:hypothetical protein
MTKGKCYHLIILLIAAFLAVMFILLTGDRVYAEVSEHQYGNHLIYDVDTPIDMYGSDETTTTEIQMVESGSSFQVTYSQDNSALVSAMESVLSSLGTDTIDKYSGDLTVYFILPSDIDTSGLSASSFTLEGSYSLYNIEDVAIEQNDSFTLISVTFTPKTLYASIDSMLSAWKENTDAKIILSGLSVPASYDQGDTFYVSAIPQGTVDADIGDIKYQFEAIPDPSAGDDGLEETFSDQDTDLYRAHVTFWVGTADTDDSTDETDASDATDASDTTDADKTTTDTDHSDKTSARAGTKGTSAADNNASAVQTGDETNVSVWLTVFALSTAALGGLYFKIRKQ